MFFIIFLALLLTSFNYLIYDCQSVNALYFLDYTKLLFIKYEFFLQNLSSFASV